MFILVDLDYPYINIFKPAIQEWKKGICPHLFWDEGIQDRHDLTREALESGLGVFETFPLVNRRDQPHQRPIGPLFRQGVPEGIELQLIEVRQDPAPLGEPVIGQLPGAAFLHEGPIHLHGKKWGLIPIFRRKMGICPYFFPIFFNAAAIPIKVSLSSTLEGLCSVMNA
jgi:hypothetical protein